MTTTTIKTGLKRIKGEINNVDFKIIEIEASLFEIFINGKNIDSENIPFMFVNNEFTAIKDVKYLISINDYFGAKEELIK